MRGVMSEQYKLVLWGASWCGPTQALRRVAHDSANHAKGDVTFEEIDVDVNKDQARTWRIEGTPTLIIVGPTGKEIERIAGYNTKDIIENMIRRAIT